MVESIKWSFSADRCARRCQRQFFLQYKAAWHTTKDPIRKEAFLLKQIKTLELWQGSVVHRALELFVVPALEKNGQIPWENVINAAVRMAREQFAFSSKGRYREPEMTKSAAQDAYCALRIHEPGENASEADCEKSIDVIQLALRNLSEMDDFWDEIRGRGKYWAELDVRVDYDIAHIEAHIDLMCFRAFGKPTIVDWKISESNSSDADLQTALYAWALCQHPKWKVSSAEDCELLEVQLLRKQVIRHQANQDIFERLENRIYRSVDQLRAMGFSEKYDISQLDELDFTDNPNNCAFCPVRSLCKDNALGHHTPGNSTGKNSKNRAKDYSRESAHPQLF